MKAIEDLISDLANCVAKIVNENPVENHLNERSEKIALLEKYSKFLEENGYLDSDWRAEEPYAIDEFLKANNKPQ